MKTERKTIGLVACTSRKGLYPAAAASLYRSPLFDGAKWYAQERCDSWFILSAKHGLLRPDERIDPYDESLNQMNESQRAAWAQRIYASSTKLFKEAEDVVFLAGDAYRSHLQPPFEKDGRRTAEPLSTLGIGRQVAWLQKLVREKTRLKDLDRVYDLLARVAAVSPERLQLLSAHKAVNVSEKRGIYFFFECGEDRMSRPFHRRIVRIGTHSVSIGSKATLWNRLRTHRGGGDGLGNHRGSIFRLHVGESLLRQSELECLFPSWGHGQSAPADMRKAEVEIEHAVSERLGQMAMTWLAVPDEASPDSDRTYLERNLIALLSGPTGPLDLPSRTWLGRWSSRDAIQASGLWNVNHVDEEYDSRALDVLESYVEVSEGRAPVPVRSLAPVGWRTAPKARTVLREQMKLV